jgi:hypothetical protein
MFPSAGGEPEVKPVGVLVAFTAFIYTRASLVGVVTEEGVPIRTLASLVPLALGVVVFGVALAVSTHDRTYVVTVTRYFFASTNGMLVLVSVGAFGTVVRSSRRSQVPRRRWPSPPAALGGSYSVSWPRGTTDSGAACDNEPIRRRS